MLQIQTSDVKYEMDENFYKTFTSVVFIYIISVLEKFSTFLLGLQWLVDTMLQSTIIFVKKFPMLQVQVVELVLSIDSGMIYGPWHTS